ncbi:sensor histidine kinase [Spirosoma spitsbergense]|uniref:sensor histidine kinase n=1 Tax=Spirosoma spitsbergense TaxID=431554 RepID=UPI000381C7A8|nr:ATP-binding protein [Spirosoma spitsbergense]
MSLPTPEGIGTVVLATVAFQFTDRFLGIKTRLPAWEPHIKRIWAYAGILIGLGFVLRLDFSTGWFALTAGLLFVYMLWRVYDYRPARIALLAAAPFLLLTVVDNFMQHYAPEFYKTSDDFLDSAIGFSTIWAITFLIIANRQKKALVEEEQQRVLETEERRKIEAKKQELEYMVSERTAEITRQKEELEQTVEELKATQTQLIQSEKMASLGELTAGIAHEIQNPLNFVNNFSEVSIELIDELAEEQSKANRDAELEAELLNDLKQNLQKITHHGGRASSIVKGMLQHSRASTGQREPTDLNGLADEYLRLAYHGLRAKDKSFNAQLKTDFDPSLGEISMIPQDMGRVLLNLFTNAFYAVHKRQKQAAEPGYQPTVSVRTRCNDGEAVIIVSDNGIGIPDDLKHKIFQPFFTTKPTGEGTGLGLSLAYDIVVKGHTGTLTVDSTEGQGTTFTITLPA